MSDIQNDEPNFITEVNGNKGVFVQGDHAAFYAMQLRHLVRYVEDNADHIDFYALNSAKKLIDLFSGCVTVVTTEDQDTGC
jgi:hypothetical protein